MRNTNGSAYEVNGPDRMIADLTNDGTRDPLDAGAKNVRVILVAPALSLFSFLYGNAEGSSQDKVQMVTTAWLVIQRDDCAVYDNADTSRTAANVDDCSLCQLKQRLRCGNLINQIATGNSGIFQYVATCSRLR
jgi:hypothetical protein